MIRNYPMRHTSESIARWRNMGAWGDDCVHELWAEAAASSPGRKMLQDSRISYTGRGLLRAISEARQSLIGAGLARGWVVAVDFNSSMFIVLHAAISSLGAVTLGVPPGLRDGELLRLLSNGHADLVLTNGDRSDRLAGGTADRNATTEQPLRVSSVGPRTTTSGEVVPEIEHVVLAECDDAGGDVQLVEPDAIYHMVSTSGTTGSPKLALRTHNSWLAMARKKVAYLRTGVPLSATDRVLVTTPVSYGLGYFHAYVIPAFLGGACAYISERFDAEAVVELVESEGITVIVGVPTQLIRMLGVLEARGGGQDWPVKLFLVGGDHLDREAAKTFERLTGALVVNVYGLVDAGLVAATAVTGSQEERFASAGKPLDWTSVKLLADGAEVVEPDVEGEIAVRAPDGIAGYFPTDEASAVTSDGYSLSGDLGRWDEDGCLHIVGRKKDVIIRGGLNISAPEIEKVLMAIPGVAMAAAVGVPDDVLGERVCAVVEVESGSSLSLGTVQEYGKSRGLPKKYWPEYVVELDSMPLNANGKLDKTRIRELAASLCGR